MPSGIYKRKKGIGVGVFGKYTRTPEIRNKTSQALMGRNLPVETIEKIRKYQIQNSYRRGKKFPELSGSNHPLWKGIEVSYIALHKWLYRALGQPDTCEFCGKSGLEKQKIHWANKSGEYKRDLRDWIRLCSFCHKKHDFKERERNKKGQFLPL